MAEHKGTGYSYQGEYGSTPEKFKALMESWVLSAEKFVEDVIKPIRISTQQREGLREISKIVNAKIKFRDHPDLCTPEEVMYAKKKGISIMSGHGTGKDTFCAWIIWWFLMCFPNPKIPCTAPTDHQLKDILWSEISKWLRLSRNRASTKRSNQYMHGAYSILDQFFTVQAGKVFNKQLEGKEWYAVARTVNTKASPDAQGETLAGFHEDFLMYVVDEASGVPDPVFKPIEGAMTGKCNLAVIIFNPTKTKGFAYDTQYGERENWISLRWNAEDSENVDQGQVEYMRKKYGRDSNIYRVRVLGLPPKSESDTFIPWDWVQAAVDREDVVSGEGDANVFGLDVGAGGDETIYLRRRGGVVAPDIDTNNSPDTMITAGWTLAKIAEEEPDFGMIDVIGIGKGVYDRVSEMRPGNTQIIGVNSSNSANDEIRYCRLRDELWDRMRTRFEQGTIRIPKDDDLIAELTTPKFKYESSGKLKVEGKREMRLRGVKSPNKADALALTFYYNDNMTRSAKTKGGDKYSRHKNEFSREVKAKRGWMCI